MQLKHVNKGRRQKEFMPLKIFNQGKNKVTDKVGLKNMQ